jgi:hypothetical protein
MGKNIYIILIYLMLSACNHSTNVRFEQEFMNSIAIINDYDQYRDDLDDTIFGRFYFATSFLETVTQIESNLVFCEHIPAYQNRFTCLKDLFKWKYWYFFNADKISEQDLDSINNIIIDKQIWWQDSLILDLVLNYNTSGLP